MESLHRRKSSKDEDETIVVNVTNDYSIPLVSAPPPPRNRVQSSPNGHARIPSARIPFPSDNHRTRATSFTPSIHSPLTPSFQSHPFQSQPLPDQIQNPSSRRHARLHSRNLSIFFPRPGAPSISEARDERVDEEAPAPVSLMPSADNNPSINFPASRSRSFNGAADPPTPIGVGFTFGARPPRQSDPTGAPELMSRASSSSSSGSTVRRGHHHKHSMSHNFFSFLEPGAVDGNLSLSPPASASVDGGASPRSPPPEELRTLSTPVPVSPWTPMSGYPSSAKSSTGSFSATLPSAPPSALIPAHHHHTQNGGDPSDSSRFPTTSSSTPTPTLTFTPHPYTSPSEHTFPISSTVTVFQFILGAWLWVCGQQIGSLAVTGLGYWVVFDAFGVGVGRVLPLWLSLDSGAGGISHRKTKRPYGNAPVETVSMFAQVVYLMFSSVYVCKETVEHLLLSGGSEVGHHHHFGDEDDNSVLGIDFPVVLALITLVSLLGTSLMYTNHSKLVNLTATRIPALRTILRGLSTTSKSRHQFQHPPPTSPIGITLSNPFTCIPVLITLGILFIAFFLPQEQHRTADVLIASIVTVVTFNVAYRACVVLGTVLLQTAPPRGAFGGKMEAFLRVMREIERHPQVLHLPAPHIWQLAPTPSYIHTTANNTNTNINANTNANGGTGASKAKSVVEKLVVTLELHVRHDLCDEDVLKLTRWAWERCASALGSGRVHVVGEGVLEGEGPEVTVGVVRG